MQAISKAGSGILKFVESFISYWDVAKEVKPKRDQVFCVLLLPRKYCALQNEYMTDLFISLCFKVERLEKEFLQSKAELERIQNDLNNMQRESSSLKGKYEDAVLEKELQLEEAKLMERRLSAADKLVLGLTFESER